MSAYPRMFRVRQTFERPRVEDVPGEVHAQLKRLGLRERLVPVERAPGDPYDYGRFELALEPWEG